MQKIVKDKNNKRKISYVLKCDEAFTRIESETLFNNKITYKLKIELPKILSSEMLLKYCLIIKDEKSERLKYQFLYMFYELVLNTYYTDLDDENNVEKSIIDIYKEIKKTLNKDFKLMLRDREKKILSALKVFKVKYRSALKSYKENNLKESE